MKKRLFKFTLASFVFAILVAETGFAQPPNIDLPEGFLPLKVTECKPFRNDTCLYLHCLCVVGCAPAVSAGIPVDEAQAKICFSTYQQCLSDPPSRMRE